MTTTCVSLGTGTIDPHARVNYAYGMVLGVEDFLTEQQHRLVRTDRHQRTLHGYGTVSGLNVAAARPADGADDVLVTVSPGMAIDQLGREVVISAAQCARIGAWLAAREQAEPGSVATHRGPSGELVLSVVLTYDSCLDDLVPLPGTPCSSSDDNAVPSRIRDAWDVDFSFDPPPMPRWDTDRRLARLLGAVEIVSGLPPRDSDEAAIIAAILDLPARVADGPDDLWPPPFTPSGGPPRLPTETAAEALDRIFTVWVTQVRPLLALDLLESDPPAGPQSPDGSVPDVSDVSDVGEPAATARILLSTITVVPADPFDSSAAVITDFVAPDDDGRPYLLHTGLLQELRAMQGEETEPPPPHELVTLAATSNPDAGTRVDAWFHLPRPVSLPKELDVLSETGESTRFTASATDAAGNPLDTSDRWLLTGPGDFRPADGEQLQVTFPGDTVVGDDGATLASLQRSGVVLLDGMPDGSVPAWVRVHGPQAAPPTPAVRQQASVEFVTATGQALSDKRIRLELWFHLQPHGPGDDAFIAAPVVEVIDEMRGVALPLIDRQPHPVHRGVWFVTLEQPDNDPPLPAYLRLLFRAGETKVDLENDGMSLVEWIVKQRILFLGWDQKDETIVAFARVPGTEQQ